MESNRDPVGFVAGGKGGHRDVGERSDSRSNGPDAQAEGHGQDQKRFGVVCVARLRGSQKF